ncbi:MAG: hypothetical protein ACRD98_00975 [Nitrososphaera sp.]
MPDIRHVLVNSCEKMNEEYYYADPGHANIWNLVREGFPPSWSMVEYPGSGSGGFAVETEAKPYLMLAIAPAAIGLATLIPISTRRLGSLIWTGSAPASARMNIIERYTKRIATVHTKIDIAKG